MLKVFFIITAVFLSGCFNPLTKENGASLAVFGVSAQEIDIFSLTVYPVLQGYCIDCHGTYSPQLKIADDDVIQAYANSLNHLTYDAAADSLLLRNGGSGIHCPTCGEDAKDELTRAMTAYQIGLETGEVNGEFGGGVINDLVPENYLETTALALAGITAAASTLSFDLTSIGYPGVTVIVTVQTFNGYYLVDQIDIQKSIRASILYRHWGWPSYGSQR